jgi:hypothetical protein
MRRLGRLRLVAYLAPVAVGLPLLAACTSILGSFEVGDVGTDSGTCPANFVLKDGKCVSTAVSCTSPDAPKCGANGKCVDTTPPAKCDCNPGYGGATCNECAQGFQDNDKNGSCTANCAGANLSCPRLGKCNDSTGTAACVCPTGYKLETPGAGDGGVEGGTDAGVVDASTDAASDGGDAGPTGPQCVWYGGPQDPTFENKPPSWTPTTNLDAGVPDGSVVIEPTAVGSVNRGWAKVDRPAMCPHGAAFSGVKQTFDMPSVADSEPFAMRIVHRGTEPNYAGQLTLHGSFGSERAFIATSFDGFQDQRLCLGEAAYGPARALTITSTIYDTPICANNYPATQFIDHVSIAPEPACPVPGTVLNGNFEGPPSQWIPSSSGGATAEVTTRGTSKVGRLATTQFCQEPRMRTKMSVPLTSMASPALEMSLTGTPNAPLRIVANIPNYTGTFYLEEVRATGTAQTVHVCVPDLFRGIDADIDLRLVSSNPVPPQTCSTPDTRELIVDDIKFVNDPGCARPMYFNNGSAELASQGSWRFSFSPGNGSNATVYNSQPNARTGTRSIQMTANQYCYGASAIAYFGVPFPERGRGAPSVAFWYKTAGTGQFDAAYVGTLAATSTYVERRMCLPSYMWGRSGSFSASVNATGGTTCGQVVSTGVLYIDDVSIQLDPACPAP